MPELSKFSIAYLLLKIYFFDQSWVFMFCGHTRYIYSLGHEYFRASVAHHTCILYVACDTKNRRSHVVNLSRVRL